mmetsp:Transcript_74289/g.176986  ORF Transcript_74289/g.176986 Transcript_74289/m.176986 type:complete len:297 (-) Transcript_74289:1251-2141(-)
MRCCISWSASDLRSSLCALDFCANSSARALRAWASSSREALNAASFSEASSERPCGSAGAAEATAVPISRTSTVQRSEDALSSASSCDTAASSAARASRSSEARAVALAAAAARSASSSDLLRPDWVSNLRSSSSIVADIFPSRSLLTSITASCISSDADLTAAWEDSNSSSKRATAASRVLFSSVSSAMICMTFASTTETFSWSSFSSAMSAWRLSPWVATILLACRSSSRLALSSSSFWSSLLDKSRPCSLASRSSVFTLTSSTFWDSCPRIIALLLLSCPMASARRASIEDCN